MSKLGLEKEEELEIKLPTFTGLQTKQENFRKTGNIKGAFCPKMITIKDKNGRDLVNAKEIKKRWKEYTKEL